MTFWLMAFALIFLTGVGFLCLVGQYNAVVTVRHRIATVVLEMDFLLQQKAADLETNAPISLDPGMLEELRMARSVSHKAASNAFAKGAIQALGNARKTIVLASMSGGSMRMQDSQIRRLDETAVKLEGLLAHYHAMLQKKPASWIAVYLLGT